MLALPTILLATAWLSPPGRLSVPTMMATIKADRQSAEQQMDAYWAMAPWEKNPQIMERFGRPTTLDLRWTVKPFDRGGVVLAAVMATQDGISEPTKASPEGQWRRIGSVAAATEEEIPLAIAKQRALIEEWTYQCTREYLTDERTFRKGMGAPPIRIAWALPPKPFQMNWPTGCLNEVPKKSAAIPADLRAGFMGTQCRSVKGKKGGFRFVSNLEAMP